MLMLYKIFDYKKNFKIKKEKRDYTLIKILFAISDERE